MPLELLAQYLKLPVFAMVASRLGGLVLFQPVLSALAVPMNLRALLILGLAAMITPLVSLPANAPTTPLAIAFAMASEVLLGALIGVLSAICYLGVQLGGQLVAQESGLAFGQVADPTTDDRESVLSVLYVQVAAVVFLIVGGHRAIMAACLDTFETIPLLGNTGVASFGADALLKALTVSGHVAFRVAGPALLALFLVNVAMGFVSRTMPQLNILAVGFSIKAMIAFLLMAVSLPSAIDALVGSLECVCNYLNELTGL